jgi:hypothetical protein
VDEAKGFVHHSVPRYWAFAYLFAALPPILFLGRCRSRVLVVLGAAICFAVAGKSLQEIHSGGYASSLVYIEHFVRTKARTVEVFARLIPPNAIVYSQALDKVLWSRWQLGIIDEPRATADSMARAIRSKLPVYIVQARFRRQGRSLEAALRSKRLRVVKVDARRGVYRVGPR